MESPSTSPMKNLTLSPPRNKEISSFPIKIENCCSLGSDDSSSSPIKIENSCSVGSGDSSSSPNKRDNVSMDSEELRSPKRPRVLEQKLWLEDLFVKKPQCTFEACKKVVDDILDNFYENNVELVLSMPKEMLIETLEKVSYRMVFHEDLVKDLDDAIKFILERIDFVTFINGEVKFLEPYGDYFAALFVTKNITEVREKLAEGIFKPENSAVKFFINEISEQDKSGPLYEMWDEILYCRVFPSEKVFPTLSECVGNILYLTIEGALTRIQATKPECRLDYIQRVLKFFKKHERLSFECYETILMSLMNQVLIADLSNSSQETTHGKLLRYSVYYQTLLLKPIYFGETTQFSNEERMVVSKMSELMEDFMLEIDDTYSCSKANLQWLEREGLYFARNYKILTEEMVLKYLNKLNKLLYGGGWQLIFAERIYTYFLKPILNTIEDEGIPEIELKNFIKLFVSITQYMFETKQRGISHDLHYSRKELLLTKSEWKGLRKWMENSEENSKLVREVFNKFKSNRPESIRCLFALTSSPAE